MLSFLSLIIIDFTIPSSICAAIVKFPSTKSCAKRYRQFPLNDICLLSNVKNSVECMRYAEAGKRKNLTTKNNTKKLDLKINTICYITIPDTYGIIT